MIRTAIRTRRAGLPAAAAVLALQFAGCGGDSGTAPVVEQDGHLYDVAGIATEPGGGRDGIPATRSRLYWPQDLVMDAGGVLLIADWNNHIVRGVRPDGTIYRTMGSGIHGDDSNGPGLSVNLNHPAGIAVGSDGNVYICGWHNWKVKMWNATTGDISSVAGTDNGFAGDGGPATEAMMSLPSSVAWDPAGNMYVSDQGNTRIRMIDTRGVITTFAGGETGFADGAGEAARFAFPTGTDAYPGGRLAVSADGLHLYVADTGNHRIRRIDVSTREVTTVAGTGEAGLSGDGGPALSARFNYPTDVACTAAGDIFVADAKNHVIRRIDAAGTVTTVAGTGVAGYSPDGTPAAEARLDTPSCVYFRESTRTLYIADTYNCQVKRVRLSD